MSASVWAPGTAIDASDVVKVQRFTATLNQTVFVLTSFVYATGNNSLQVYTDGVFQGVDVDFTETSSSSFTLAEGVPAGTIVTAVGQIALNTGSQYADAAAASAAAALVSENAAAASASAADVSADAALVSQNAAAASAANVVDWDWLGDWVTTTAYKVNNSVSAPAGTYQGWSVICLVDHTSGTFATDYGAGKWGVLAQRGAVGAGTGDMLAANNLSDVTSVASSRTNLGLTVLATTTPGTNVATALAVNLANGGGFVPTGTMLDFAGTAAPTGFLACDGAAVSRATYAALFTAISTTWGVGDGATTFNLPNAQRRVTVGSGGSGTATLANSVASTGGSETHTLVTAEMPAHTHDVTAFASGGSYAAFSNVAGSQTITSTSTGGGVAHNNMQPSMVVLKIIKT